MHIRHLGLPKKVLVYTAAAKYVAIQSCITDGDSFLRQTEGRFSRICESEVLWSGIGQVCRPHRRGYGARLSGGKSAGNSWGLRLSPQSPRET